MNGTHQASRVSSLLHGRGEIKTRSGQSHGDVSAEKSNWVEGNLKQGISGFLSSFVSERVYQKQLCQM